MQFREHHLSKIMGLFSFQTPLDLFLGRYFRANKAIGSKDRKYISDAVYERIRWKGLFDHLGRLGQLGSSGADPHAFLGREEIPQHIRLSFPKELFDLLRSAYGPEAAAICLASNQRAPATIRANLLKTTRQELFDRLKSRFEVSLCKRSPWGIVFHEKLNFSLLPEFQEGLFEVQDEGSQLTAALVAAEPKQTVLDYCAGAGGKTLALAPLMRNKGQIYLHDVRTKALEEASKRLRRAGVQNAQTRLPPHGKKTADWVLVDVPCSGTGTLKRNPDLKWKFSQAALDRLVQEQREIFEEALQYLRSGGKIVYATCSLLPDENERQTAYFQEKFGLTLLQELRTSVHEMDGFYGAVLSYTQTS